LKVLVTGGTGFIGSHVVEALVENGFKVRCLVRDTSSLKWLDGLPVDYVRGDCRDRASLREAVSGMDQVFHLAAVTKAVNEAAYFQVNAVGTANVVDACIANNGGVQRFIYLSSQAAAGPSRNRGDKTEADPCNPVSLYGLSKREGEKSVLAHRHQLSVVILRPSAVYGPRDKDFLGLLKVLARRIKPILGAADRRISLCYVTDLVDAIMLACRSQNCDGEVFFVADGCEYQVKEILDVFADTMGAATLTVPLPDWMIWTMAGLSLCVTKLSRKPCLLSRDKVRDLAGGNWACDITKARTTLGFEPGVRLSEGARLTVQWYKENQWL